MDAFKNGEIQRMELGGNEPWKSFYDAHPVTVSEGRTFDDSTIKERYEGDAGEEWKERLACKVDGREYVQGQEKKNNTNASRSSTPMSLGGGGGGGAARTGSPAASSIRSHGSQRGGAPTKKEQNEAYFAKLGNDNSTRTDALPPSQGGKFTGFGGGLPPSPAGDRQSSPFGGFGGFGGWGGGGGGAGGGNQALDDFQKDPMASLTKGFGWFASTVGKGAKTVNDSYLQPTAKQVRTILHIPELRLPRASSLTIFFIYSSRNPTWLLKLAFKRPTGARICKLELAVPQTSSTVSWKAKRKADKAPLARALTQNAETSGTTFHP